MSQECIVNDLFSKLSVCYSEKIFHDVYPSIFIEFTGSGNVVTTTITEKGVSVHSRNSVVFGKLIPSQYYRTCKIGR